VATGIQIPEPVALVGPMLDYLAGRGVVSAPDRRALA
jgi:hypothetical protein